MEALEITVVCPACGIKLPTAQHIIDVGSTDGHKRFLFNCHNCNRGYLATVVAQVDYTEITASNVALSAIRKIRSNTTAIGALLRETEAIQPYNWSSASDAVNRLEEFCDGFLHAVGVLREKP